VFTSWEKQDEIVYVLVDRKTGEELAAMSASDLGAAISGLPTKPADIGSSQEAVQKYMDSQRSWLSYLTGGNYIEVREVAGSEEEYDLYYVERGGGLMFEWSYIGRLNTTSLLVRRDNKYVPVGQVIDEVYGWGPTTGYWDSQWAKWFNEHDVGRKIKAALAENWVWVADAVANGDYDGFDLYAYRTTYYQERYETYKAMRELTVQYMSFLGDSLANVVLASLAAERALAKQFVERSRSNPLKAAIQAVGKDMNNQKFAQYVVKWGTGPAQAQALLEELVGLVKNNNITEITRRVNEWKSAGLTPQHAMNIAEAYWHAARFGRGGDTAPIRARLMEFVAYLIKEYGK
jgi:hypothetical protein